MKCKAIIEFSTFGDDENGHKLPQTFMNLLSSAVDVKTVSIIYVPAIDELNQTNQLKILVGQALAMLDKINLSIAKLRIESGFNNDMVQVYKHLGNLNKYIMGIEPEINALIKSIDKLPDTKGYLLSDPTQCPNCKSKII